MAAPLSKEEKHVIFKKCRYSLLGHSSKTPAQILLDLAQNLNPEARGDFYGTGSLIEDFEKKIARVLGFPSAVFMPSGTMAQTIALRIWSDRKKTKKVAFHPKSHLEIHEHKAYSVLHHLESEWIGGADRLFTLEDLKACSSPLAALLIELPQRDLGGLLPTWEELKAISDWARERQVALHLDGARLWECQPFYQKDYSEIASLFDSTYVSFYKGLGGIAGAVLAGPKDFISEAKIWQRRHGGNLISLYPYVFSADNSFETRIGRMGQYHQKAKEIAKILSSFPGVKVTPDPPHINMMGLMIPATADQLNQAVLEMALEQSIDLFHEFRPSATPGTCWTEITVGDAALELPEEKISGFLQAFFKKLHLNANTEV
jgi:threonine aldolase